MRFTARPRADGGASRRMRWHRGDPRRSRPLMGSRPRPTPEGGAVTVSRFLCEGRLQGVSYLINRFGVSIKHAILGSTLVLVFRKLISPIQNSGGAHRCVSHVVR